MDVVAAEFSPAQPDHVDADKLGPLPERKAERNDIAGNPAHPAEHGAFADAAELMHRCVAADEDMIARH